MLERNERVQFGASGGSSTRRAKSFKERFESARGHASTLLVGTSGRLKQREVAISRTQVWRQRYVWHLMQRFGTALNVHDSGAEEQCCQVQLGNYDMIL